VERREKRRKEFGRKDKRIVGTNEGKKKERIKKNE
jgi:hypothetical protein